MKNHVIPKCFIKRFADDRGRIWFYSKPKQGGEAEIRHVGWKGIFIRKDIYDKETEDRLASLDGHANGVVKRIEKEGPQDVTLNATDKLTLCEFLGIQLLRSEKTIHELTCDKFIDGYVRNTHRVLRPSRELFHEEVLGVIRLMINGGIRGWVNPERPEWGQLTFENLHLIAIPDSLNENFLLGDSVPILYSRRPSLLDRRYTNDLVNPNCIKVLPVTPKCAIAFCRENEFNTVPVGKLVEAINTTMFNGCLAVAAYEKTTIQSLLSSPHTRKTYEETLEVSPFGVHLNG